ncbi:MAG: formylglycine-generating enzyme family protein [Candidatus Rifleibacteriota bacterium]
MSNFFDWIKEKINEIMPGEEDKKGSVKPINVASQPVKPGKTPIRQAAASPQGEPAPKNDKAENEIFKNSLGMEFCQIPSGQFFMGSTVMENEQPLHRVHISKNFYLGKHTVTQQHFIDIMGYNPAYSQGEKLPALNMLAAAEHDEAFFSKNPPPEQPDFIPDLPVENLTWEEATEFCKKLSAKEGRIYRLPTEAEWEYACRAGTLKEFYWGKSMDERFCNYANIFAIRSGRRGENPWGLCDMLGNVWEWCSDWYGPYSDAEATDPAGPSSGTEKVYRGGSYDIDIDTNCRCASRFADSPANRRPDVGFRVLLEK